jgi:acetylornithine deacetylase/succinyl-diaminopimelate desuccinylase-like protein
MAETFQMVVDYARSNRDRFTQELIEVLRIPSISTSAEHASHVLQCAQWLKDHLLTIGLQRAKVLPTELHPVVYGEYLSGSSLPTILIYGHYDVQPPDPFEQWTSSPFEPEIRTGKLYARGATDMKGQLMVALKAVESLLKMSDLLLNIKFILEGEEEIGSPSMDTFLKQNKRLLDADIVLNLDAGMASRGVPSITYGLRGLAYFEIHVRGPQSDLHSGLFGGVVHNPAQALCELIAGMHDANGRITLPGFYDQVQPLSKDERELLSQSPTDEQHYLTQTGVQKLWGEPDFTPLERIGARPTLEVNGLRSGFIGDGAKTVIPSEAMAKISMRLVPDQSPDEVHQQLRTYMASSAPDTIEWKVILLNSGAPSITNLETPISKAFERALETNWGRHVVYKREGGSIPIVEKMQQILGLDSILSGFALPEDQMHAPNENLDLDTWAHGIETVIQFFYNLAILKESNNVI